MSITVPRAWFERLNAIVKQIEVSQEDHKNLHFNMLLGYCSSAETILKINNDDLEIEHHPYGLTGLDGLSITKTKNTYLIDRAKEVMGENFYGAEQIKKAFGIEVDEPRIPYTYSELVQAKREGFMLVLFLEKTAKEIEEITKDKYKAKGWKLFYNTNWYENEKFFTEEKPTFGWKLVKNRPDLVNLTYNEQTEKMNPNKRLSFSEIVQLTALVFLSRYEEMWESKYCWTSSCSSGGYLVLFGRAGAGGAIVSRCSPSYSSNDLGTSSSRRGSLNI